MPEDLGEAQLKTSVDLSGLEAGLDEAEQLGESRFARAGSIMGSALQTAIVGAAAGAATAILAIGGAAISIADQFNTSQEAIRVQLGTTAEEAERLTGVVENIYGNNVGQSVEDVTAALIETRRQVKGLAEEDLESVTTAAIQIRDQFGQDMPKVLNSVNVLMEDFGLTSDQALDFIASGFQSGLDNSGDFLDSIGEYGVQFSSGGASAEQFFSIMESGMQGGVLGTDKAADAFKEFRVRIQDGSDSTSEALQALGVDTDELFAKMASGEVTAADAFDMVVGKLGEVDDANARMQIGVALLGTQFEDLGTEGALALDMSATSMEDLVGATASLTPQYQSLGQVLEGLKRTFQVALRPLGDKLLELANKAMPHVQRALEWLGSTVPPIIDAIVAAFELFFGSADEGSEQISMAFATIQGVIQGVGDVVKAVMGAMSQFVADHGQEIADFFQASWGKVQGIIQTAVAIIHEGVIPLLQNIGQFIAAHTEEIKGLFSGAWLIIQGVINTALGVIQGILSTVLALIRGDWDAAWEGVKSVFSSAWEGIKLILSGALEIVQGALSMAWDAIKLMTEGAWGGLSEFFSDWWDTLRQGFSTAVGGIQSFLGGAWDAIKQGAATAWGGIANVITGLMSGVVAALKMPINAAIAAVNGMIDGVNTVNIFSGLTGEIPHIPYLAKGTSFFQGGFAVVGEEGPELVSMPRGSQVIPNRETESMLGGGGSTININNPIVDSSQRVGELRQSLLDLFHSELDSLGGTGLQLGMGGA